MFGKSRWLCMACGARLVSQRIVEPLGRSYPPNSIPFRNEGTCDECGKEAKVGGANCLFQEENHAR